MKLHHRSIKFLLIGFSCTMAVLLAATAAGGLASTRKAVDAMQQISLEDVATQAMVGEIRLHMETSRSHVLQALQHNPASDYAKMHDHPLSVHFEAIGKNQQEIQRLWNSYRLALRSGDEKALAERWYADSGKLGTDSVGVATGAIEAGQWDEAQKTLIRVLNPRYRAGDAAAAAFNEVLRQRALDDNAAVLRDIASTRQRVLAGLLIVVAIMGIAAWFILGAITAPLQQAVEIARRVADGDVGATIDVAATNEFGKLLMALNTMSGSLVAIVSRVRTGANAIASASSQIASANQDLAVRTEQQAASLEATATSMDELTGAFKLNGEHARSADDLAQSASRIALKGGDQVAKVRLTMDGIHASAQKIVAIIEVIDGIAFQTNILALNAAVEAARAGAEGRGFAVVASEVRTLAQRSSSAAKEIKQLIDDSMRKVEEGNATVDHASATMNDILTSVAKVSTVIGKISAASQEQGPGIERINGAIGAMDAATEQNSCLVEQSAAASAALHEQAVALDEVVRFFHLGDDAKQQPVEEERLAPSANRPTKATSSPRQAPMLRA